MKQIRMMALMGMTLLMGVVMIACLSSKEGDNKATQTLVAVYENGAFTQQGGGTLIPLNSTYLPSTPGFYYIEIEYDPTTWSDGKLNVTLLSAPEKVDTYDVVKGTEEGNINLYAVEYRDNQGGYLAPQLFNQDYLVIPCFCWVEDVQSTSDLEKEIKKHHFILQAPADLHNSDGVLELTLYDVVDDPTTERFKPKHVDYIFNIHSIVEEFKITNNGKLSKILISGMVNNNSYDPTHSSTKKDSFELDLTPFQ